ncbi:flagellar filament capping protein FliD [Salinisphaera sp. Q1T1-3]|uniref:flagellar filament capping protein FliD n=1 Tax=Salinisphaera sp. Q1T1-3 TaxID=2321229 RepID=UPI000E709FFA|nr:flagellar filament capping protein FliD [Salinisphaera sp. Q1T1-3]RJS95196.1 flagellar filament capping protein FliD [Salinisphaera sp. Q1T1-3]
MASISSSTLSSLGVGSGLDLSSLLDNLKANEQNRLVPLQNRKASFNTQFSAYGALTNSLTNLKDAADKLAGSDLYHAAKVGVEGDAVTATTDQAAVAGGYDVSVSQLARAQSLVGEPVADKDADIGGGGKISIAIGDADATEINLPKGGSSLTDIRDAINGAGAGVSASIIDDGSDTPFHLVLSSDNSGTANQITVKATDAAGASGTPLADLVDYDSQSGQGSMRETVAARDAKLTVNGVSVTRNSNTVDNAIDGVTLTLHSTTTEPSRVTTTRDNDQILGAIKSFVSAYNSYQKRADSLTAFNGADASGNGVLLGDSTARSVESELHASLTEATTGGAFSVLGDIGISLQTDGTLKIEDEDQLDAALTDNPNGVAALFGGDAGSDDENAGIAGGLSATIARMTDDNGLLSTARDGLQRSIDDVDKRIANMRDSIDATVERYRKQFVQLDSMMSSLNSTQSYLTTQLSQLNGSSSS